MDLTGDSRPPHGGRGLKLLVDGQAIFLAGCRPPHGGRGLKSFFYRKTISALRRPPHGGRGLKYVEVWLHEEITRRPPHGGRGLKWDALSTALYSGRVVLHTEDVD